MRRPTSTAVLLDSRLHPKHWEVHYNVGTVQYLLNGFKEAFKGPKCGGDRIMFVFQKDQKRNVYTWHWS